MALGKPHRNPDGRVKETSRPLAWEQGEQEGLRRTARAKFEGENDEGEPNRSVCARITADVQLFMVSDLPSGINGQIKAFILKVHRGPLWGGICVQVIVTLGPP